MDADYIKAVNSAKMLLISTFNQNIKYPVNLADILNNQGLKALYDESISEEALLNPMKQTIYIKKDNKPITRKLFSIAHEIGHWILHSRDKIRHRLSVMSDINEVDRIEEQEANAFAAELLMPYSEVSKLIFLGYGVEHLMDYFNVSYEFAYYRYNYVYGMIY